MVENIRRIGIFMIAAQTVLHFAAGKQYEKYLKIITGVIILLQFVTPFTSSADDFALKWQSEIDRMEQQVRSRSDMRPAMPNTASPIEAAALPQIEEAVKERLNDMVPDCDCVVTDVEIGLEQVNAEPGTTMAEGSRSWVFSRMKVTIQGASEEDVSDVRDEGIIRIEDIKVGREPESDAGQPAGQDEDRNAKTREYQQLFAQTLGIAEERVEVIYRGEW